VTQASFGYVKHARLCSWNQPVLIIEGKVSWTRKQRGLLMGLEFNTYELERSCDFFKKWLYLYVYYIKQNAQT